VSALEIIILLPIFAAFAVWLGAPARPTSLVASLGGLALSVVLAVQYHSHPGGGMAFAAAHTVLAHPHIQFAVGADGLSLTMALLTTLVTSAAIWSVVDKERIYYIASLLISAGALGAFLSTDLFFIYSFHELALIPTLLMIALHGHGEDRRAVAWKITIYLGAASLVLLLGLLGTVWYCSPKGGITFDLLALKPFDPGGKYASFAPANFFTLLIGFGALVSLFPFHAWAAPAYAGAPTPVAMLHAGVLKKFGIYGLIRIAMPLFPGMVMTPWIQQALLLMLLGNILVVGFITIHQRRLDDTLANSSVMHMGYIFLGLAAGNALGQNGAALLMFAHGVSIALLFLLCGKLRSNLGTLEYSRLGGLASNAPFLGLVFGFAVFASIGLPGLANFAGEILVFLGAFQSFGEQGFGLIHVTTILSLWGVVISAVYMLRAYRQVFFGEAETGLFITDPTLAQRVPMFVLAGVLLVVGCQPSLLLNLIKTAPVAVTMQAPVDFRVGLGLSPVKTAPVAATKESFAKDLALAGWRQTGDGSVIILVNTRTREYMRLKNHEPAPDGTKVKKEHLADRREDAFVELERSNEAPAVVRYDESFIRQLGAKPRPPSRNRSPRRPCARRTSPPMWRPRQ